MPYERPSLLPSCDVQVTRNGSDLWLSYWVSELDTHTHHHHHHHHHNLSSQSTPTDELHVLANAWNASGNPFSVQDIGSRGVCLMPAPTRSRYSSLGSLSQCHRHVNPTFAGPTDNANFSTSLNAASAASAVASGLSHAVPMATQLLESLPQSRPALDPDTKFYLIVLLSIAAANSAFTFVRAFSFAYGGLAAARKLHEQLLTAVIDTPASFFQVTLPGESRALLKLILWC